MILFDSHCHLEDDCYDNDLQETIERAQNENVHGIMIAGVDIDRALKAIEIASAYHHIITAVGFHPHDAKLCSRQNLATLAQLARDNACVKAWGEIGLDFNRMFSPVKDQEDCFLKQMEIADSLDLPLIFHERDSKGRFYDMIKSDAPKSRNGVIHCFSGTKDELFKYLDLGYYIGITGILTLKERGHYLRRMAPLIPEDRILIETDAPYLTPAPQKNKFRRNEPAFVKSVLIKLAQVRNADPEILSQVIFDNTRTLYRVDF